MRDGEGRAVAAGGAGKRSDHVDCSLFVDLKMHTYFLVREEEENVDQLKSTTFFNPAYYTLAGQSDMSIEGSMLHTRLAARGQISNDRGAGGFR